MRWRRRDPEPTLDEKLRNVEERLHVMEGVLVGLRERAAVHEVLDVSGSIDDAIGRLQERLGLDEVQATVITDMQVRRFVPAEVAKVEEYVREMREQRQAYLRQGARPRQDPSAGSGSGAGLSPGRR
jgi:DNA gyrase subunit A